MPPVDDTLATLLDLERIDANVFRGPHPGEQGFRLFGGQVASQALRAAGATVPSERVVNSLHAYFLRPGRFGLPVVFTVDRIRDGGSFTTRRVVATQDGEAILNLDASFHVVEDGPRYEPPSPIGDVPDPESLPREPNRRGRHQRFIDTRIVPRQDPDGGGEGSSMRWVRSVEHLSDDPMLHACAITYLSDSGLVSTARRSVTSESEFNTAPIGRSAMMSASLDHCLWFHQPVRADDWLLYRLEPVAVMGARGLARGEVWTQSGQLAATVTQESLQRPHQSS